MRNYLILCFLLAAPLAASAFREKGVTLQASGNQSDVQAAVDAAAEGSTVTIPSGTFDWSGQLTIKKAIKLAGQGTDQTIIRNQNGGSAMIVARSGKSGNIEISGLAIQQIANNGSGRGFMIDCGRDESTNYTVKLHDCSFDELSIYNYSVLFGSNGILCWNCKFVGSGRDGMGGISLVVGMMDYSLYNQPSTLGTRDSTGLKNSYIEDCAFSNCLNGANFDANSRAVVRHNQFKDAALGSHGQETSPNGVTSWEIYENTFKLSPDNPVNNNYWLQARGGTGVFANNQVDDIVWNKSEVILTVFAPTRGANDGAGGSFCPIEYPAPRQTGWSWANNGANWGKVEADNTSLLEGGRSPGYFLPDGKGAQVDPVYIWGNTGSGANASGFLWVQTYTPDNCGNNQDVANTYLRAGRDYYLNAGPKPGWTPYTYPHPMRTGGGPNPTPTPPQPTPTPTPPQPTPTPPQPTPTPPQPTPTPAPTPPGSHKYQILMESDSPMYWTPLPQATP